MPVHAPVQENRHLRAALDPVLRPEVHGDGQRPVWAPRGAKQPDVPRRENARSAQEGPAQELVLSNERKDAHRRKRKDKHKRQPEHPTWHDELLHRYVRLG